MQGPDVSSSMWENDDPRAVFMRRLIRQRAVEFMRSPKYLRSLRFRNDLAVRDQRMFGHIWEEYKTNVYQLIAEAHGETWDAETEQKEQYRARHDAAALQEKIEAPVNQRERDDDLVAAREAGSREREHQLQGEPEASIRLVEEDEGRGGCKKACCEEARAEEEGRRSGRFYRRAGGSGGLARAES